MNRREFNKFMAAAVAGLVAGTALPALAQTPTPAPGGDKSKCKGKDGCKGKDTCKSKDGKDTCKSKDSCKSKDKCKGKDGCKGTDSK